jgi:HlyD family secretion protein
VSVADSFRWSPRSGIALVVAGLALGTLLALPACHRAVQEPAVYVVEPATFSRRVTAEGNLKAKTATAVSAPQNAEGALKIAWIVDDGAVVKKDDVVVRFDPSDFNALLTGGRENRSTADNNMIRTDVAASTTKTNLQRDAGQAEAELAAAKRFRTDDAEIFSRYQQIESEADQHLAADRRDHAHKVLGVRETLSNADRNLVTIEAHKADLQIHNAEQGLSSIEVRAPYDGILVLQRDWRGDVPRVGATVWSGFRLGEIPDLKEMNAEVFVLEADAAGLAVGQKAAVTLESQPGVVYHGRISQLDKLARPRVRNVPVQYFGATIALDRTDPGLMKPGARVRAVLDVENRANAFSIPRQALFEKNGKRIVYRRNGTKFDAVPVTIGSSSAGRVVVTSGVARGDRLALTDVNAREGEAR